MLNENPENLWAESLNAKPKDETTSLNCIGLI